MILFVQTAFLGDLLLSIPTLKMLRKNYPEQKIHLVCRKGLGSIIKNFGLADVIHDDFKNTKPTIGEWRKRFAGLHFDLLICPHESFRSKLLCAMTSATKKVGYSSFIGSLIFDITTPRPMHWPEVFRQLALLRSELPELKKNMQQLPETFRVYEQIPEWASMVIVSPQQKKHWRSAFLQTNGLDPLKRIVALAPGSVWPTKRWPLEKFIEVARHYQFNGHHVIIVGSKDEKIFGDAIQSEVSSVLNLCGKTSLVQLIEVLAACDVLVSNDSGSMHMAATAGTPIVSIFGPTVLSFGYQPWSEAFRVVEIEGLKCRPCSSHGGRVCPIGTHECMKLIHSDTVITASGAFLDIK